MSILESPWEEIELLDGSVKVLPPEHFGDEYAPPDPRYAGEGRGPDADAIGGLLFSSCAGWVQAPTSGEFYEAMRAAEPTPDNG